MPRPTRGEGPAANEAPNTNPPNRKGEFKGSVARATIEVLAMQLREQIARPRVAGVPELSPGARIVLLKYLELAISGKHPSGQESMAAGLPLTTKRKFRGFIEEIEAAGLVHMEKGTGQRPDRPRLNYEAIDAWLRNRLVQPSVQNRPTRRPIGAVAVQERTTTRAPALVLIPPLEDEGEIRELALHAREAVNADYRIGASRGFQREFEDYVRRGATFALFRYAAHQAKRYGGARGLLNDMFIIIDSTLWKAADGDLDDDQDADDE